MTRPRLVVHGHFYQPSRIDPATGLVPVDPTAAPARDWNARIAADCYRPNAELGNLGRMSWDLGPTLAGYLEDADPVAYRGFVAGDHGVNGLAQPFHHTILPLGTTAERRTEVRWGLRDFELRFGRRATGLWLPETAVDLETLRLLVDEGITHTILAPWQVWAPDLDTRRAHRIELDGGRSIVVALYDAGLSTSVSFEVEATRDADRFAYERIGPRLYADGVGDDEPPPFALIATDGELYGHHQAYRDMFLARLVGDADLGYDVATLADVVREDGRPFRTATLVENTSWSCHHGIHRWREGCGCVTDGAWKAPLRAALDRLAEGIDTQTELIARTLPGSPDPWAARDAYIDVIVGDIDGSAFAGQWLGRGADQIVRRRFLDVMAAQRWRLAMYASCGWFWESSDRIETALVIRAADCAARVVDGLSGTRLADRLVEEIDAIRAGNPSARGLRATG